MRSEYKELGLDLVEPLQYEPCKTRRPPMVEEKKYERVGYPFKMLLEEAIEWQRDAMMEKFSQILRWLPTSNASSSNNHSGGTTPFEVQVNFDIPIFESKIDAYIVDRWLNFLKGYFSVRDFSNRENIAFSLLKVTPQIKH